MFLGLRFDCITIPSLPLAMEEKLELFLVGGIERMRAGIVRNEGKYRTKKCLLVQQSRKKVKKERNSLKINRLFYSLFCLRRDEKLIKNKIFASFQAKNKQRTRDICVVFQRPRAMIFLHVLVFKNSVLEPKQVFLVFRKPL